MRNLSFSSLLSIIQKQVRNAYIDLESGKKGVSQQEAVYLLYKLVWGEDEELYVSTGNATKLFHQQANVTRAVMERAMEIEAAHRQAQVEERVRTRILCCLNEQEKRSLWLELQTWLQEAQPVTAQVGLNDFLGQEYGEEKLRTLLASCTLLCLKLTNKSERRDREPRAKQLPPNYRMEPGKRYDPHSLAVGRRANSDTLEFHLLGENLNKLFYSCELTLEFIRDRNLYIRNIQCTSHSIELRCDPLPKKLCFRRLEEADFYQVREGIRTHPEEVRKKISWQFPLYEATYQTLFRGEMTGYGYFTPEGVLVSYLDCRQRIDGGVELGTQITDPAYRHLGLTTGLIYLFQLKFMGSILFIGTYEENRRMIRLLSRCGFLPHLFYDMETRKNTNKVRDRLGRDGSTEPEDMTNSVYFYATSLKSRVYQHFLEEQNELNPRPEGR